MYCRGLPEEGLTEEHAPCLMYMTLYRYGMYVTLSKKCAEKHHLLHMSTNTLSCTKCCIGSLVKSIQLRIHT